MNITAVGREQVLRLAPDEIESVAKELFVERTGVECQDLQWLVTDTGAAFLAPVSSADIAMMARAGYVRLDNLTAGLVLTMVAMSESLKISSDNGGDESIATEWEANLHALMDIAGASEHAETIITLIED